MGCFDTVKFRCPNCNAIIDAQTKGGVCASRYYDALSVPLDVAGGVVGEDVTCESCGIWLRVGGVGGNRIALSLFPIPRGDGET